MTSTTLLRAATAALILGLSGAPAGAATPDPLANLLSPQDLPAAWRRQVSPQGNVISMTVATAPWGLQLCTSGPGGSQVSIAGPATSDRLLLPLGDTNSLVLSTSLYRFSSAGQARQAWQDLRAAAPRCRGSLRGADGQITTVSSGGSPRIWVETQMPQDTAARYAVYSRHGAVILVTGLSRLDSSSITSAEQAAVQQVADRIGQKLDAHP
ncbi:MAG: hypothetical protein VKM98_04140 [Cyanobacteriota bacterium]|nr:hypothetical protein [Cyanobacteriota bacterium]